MLCKILYILSRASEAGSPMNRLGSDKTRGQGSFGPSTGGPDLQGLLVCIRLVNGPCLVAAWSQGGISETLPRWHATI